MTDISDSLLRELSVFLFTDLVGSTELNERLGGEAYVAHVLRPHNDLFRRLLVRFQGTENNYTGDGFLATFRRISDAVNFALTFQQGLRGLAANSEMPDVRIGIHFGEYVVIDEGAAGRKISGDAVNACARVMGLAEGRQILMTRHIYDDARQHVRAHPACADADTPVLQWCDHGEYVFKGRQDSPVNLFEVGAVGFAPLKPPCETGAAKRYYGEVLNAEKHLGSRVANANAIAIAGRQSDRSPTEIHDVDALAVTQQRRSMTRWDRYGLGLLMFAFLGLIGFAIAKPFFNASPRVVRALDPPPKLPDSSKESQEIPIPSGKGNSAFPPSPKVPQATPDTTLLPARNFHVETDPPDFVPRRLILEKIVCKSRHRIIRDFDSDKVILTLIADGREVPILHPDNFPLNYRVPAGIQTCKIFKVGDEWIIDAKIEYTETLKVKFEVLGGLLGETALLDRTYDFANRPTTGTIQFSGMDRYELIWSGN